ncbi:hypothetical protein RJ639_026957 [Escallonia herrerae]|uniref:Uncharacterized protein n=1 Tax=Escallonia herrerae TaxID=1293975 RepID=A0AA89BQS4_9ASTE|nr:hypothetical protein RJ639_026957 [Escallonia herrerae]
MIHLFRKTLQHSNPRILSSTTSYGCLFSISTINSADPQSVTVSYLVNSCGLSLDSAISTANKLQIGPNTIDRADSVLKLLKSHGLTQTHIRSLVSKRPVVLLADPSKAVERNIELFSSLGLSGNHLAKVLKELPRILESSNVNAAVELFKNHGFSQEQIAQMVLKRPHIFAFDPEKNLKPKLEFLCSLGIPKSKVARMVCGSPALLERSLEHHFIPRIHLLKKFFQTDENVARAVMCNSQMLITDLEKQFLPNVSTLMRVGVTESRVLKWATPHSPSLFRSTERFSKIVSDVTAFGFHVEKKVFLLAVHTLSLYAESLVEQKIQVFNSFGLSRDDYFAAFKLQPMVVWTSVKKLRKVIDFFVNKLHFKPSVMSRHPNLFLLSLEKRIIPRCSVLQLLMSKDLVARDIYLVTVFKLTKQQFLENFVIKYQEVVPEVVKAHLGEIEFSGFDKEIFSRNSPIHV